MKKKLLIAATLATILSSATIVGSAVAEIEEEVTLEEVPDAVRTTILEHAGQGEITEIEAETNNGVTVYEAEVMIGGKEVEFQVSAAGEYLGPEAEDDDDGEEEEEEREVALEDAPQGVQDQIAYILPNAEIESVTVEREDGYTLYEASVDINGVEHEVELTDEGYVIEIEEEVSSESLPAAVLNRVAQQFPDATIGEANAVELTFYELEITDANGNTREISVLANGRVLSGDN